jgi:hypothetical protein
MKLPDATASSSLCTSVLETAFTSPSHSSTLLSFLEKRRTITVKIEVEKSAIRLDVLAQVPQERALAGAGLTKDGNMHRTAGIAKAHMPPSTTRTRDQFLAMLRTPAVEAGSRVLQRVVR